MIIDSFDTSKKVFVIAEVGNNHEGDFSLAQDLIGLAAKAGASAVKFQTIVPEKLVSSSEKERIAQLKRFELSYDQFQKLSEVAKKEGILFLSTPFDLDSARFLNTIVPAFKVASGDNNFWALIEYLCSTKKPLIVSTGLLNLEEIKSLLAFIKKMAGANELAFLHCVAKYPVPKEDENLQMISELKKLNVTVGYSDHTLGIEAALSAVSLGARIIEKHFTINKNHSNFRDHQLSADPSELKELVRRIDDIKPGQEKGPLNPIDTSHETALKVRRSIAVNKDLEAQAVVGLNDLTWLRPGTGLAPGSEDKVIGKKLKRALSQGEIIYPLDID